MWSAATSGAGGQEAPPGQLAASSAWTAAALEVGFGQEQADVQFRPRLYLEGRLLAVVQEGGREPEASPVLVDDLGGGTGAGEETGVEVGQLRHQRPADDNARDPRLDGGARGVECVGAVQLELLVGDRLGARLSSVPRGRQSLTTERPPNAARGDGDDEGEHGEQGEGDDDGHDEARGPGRAVGPLECGLLPRRAEHAAEAVNHELDAQEEGDHGKGERRSPEVAAQPPVEHARGDEAARQSRVVQALHPGQPGPVGGGHGVNGRIPVGPQRARTHEHGACAGSRLAQQVDAVAHGHAVALEHPHEGGVALRCRYDDDHLRVGPGGKGRQGVGERRMLLDDGRRFVATPRRHQASAHNHDAGPLPLVEPLGDVAAGGSRTVGGLRGEQEIADHLHPPAEGDRQRAVLAGCHGLGLSYPRFNVGFHSPSIVSPSQTPATPQFGGFLVPLKWERRR
jgi:hypothetical protein